MSELPEGWARTNLGEVIFFNYGKSLAAAKRKGGSIDVYGSNGVVGQHNEAIIQSPAIIVGRKGSFGEVHFSKAQCFPIDTTYFVDEFPATEAKFAFSLLKHLPLKEMNRATAIPGLNREDAHSLSIQLPPLAEQKRIVRKLDTLSARTTIARTHLTAINNLVERYKAGFQAAALGGKLSRQRLAAASGVTFTLHDLRRTYITIAESLDIPHYALKRLLNHRSSDDVTGGYIIINVDRLRGPVELISERILEMKEAKD